MDGADITTTTSTIERNPGNVYRQRAKAAKAVRELGERWARDGVPSVQADEDPFAGFPQF